MTDWSEKTGLKGAEFPLEDYESCKSSENVSNAGEGTSGPFFLSYFRKRKNLQRISDQNNLHRDDRVMKKNGMRNFQMTNIIRHSFSSDLFTTILELRWRWILASVCLVYFGSWLSFAGAWYLIAYVHGDIENFGIATWTPCVSGVRDFASVFLFSVETQHTIGYGFYHLTEECTTGVLLLCIQSIVGVLLEGLVVGLVFLKISRAKKRAETLIFSQKAVICHRDGKRFFMFRVADTRSSYLLEARVRAQILIKRFTQEGEIITQSQEEIKVGGDGEKDDRLLLFWPTTVIHEITESSPMDKLTQADFVSENIHFEIIVVLEGVVETTGLMTQARSSYFPGEIIWGSRFQTIPFQKSPKTGQKIMDYSLINNIISET